jgi:hypothetical protein
MTAFFMLTYRKPLEYHLYWIIFNNFASSQRFEPTSNPE